MDENDIGIEQIDAEEVIKQRILIIRNCRVMIDADLAKLYGVTTKHLNRSILRNISRFPKDFMFQLSEGESESLRYQIGTSNVGRGGRRYLPYVFTEHGVAMLSSVLNSERAVQMNIFIIRAFIKMRELVVSNKELAFEVDSIKRKQKDQGDLLTNLQNVVTQMIEKPPKQKSKVGFNDTQQI